MILAPSQIPDRTLPSELDAPAHPDVTAAVVLVRRLFRGLRRAEQRSRAGSGVSAAGLFVLTKLAEREVAASLTQLASCTLTDRTSVAAVVDRLVAGGYVTTARDAADRRRTVVSLTDAGRRAVADAPHAPTIQLVAALERMRVGDLRAVIAGLECLVEELGYADGPAPMLFEDGVESPGESAR